uniref:Uncharacterized protein LOC108045908 n=1 Tax=Drosophila rhopaloa TaxID=1041015 RepID=A0A6P4EVX3_DRORH
MRIDLKELLLVSMSTTPSSVIHLHKRFKCGKVSYMVHCMLQKGQLLILQVKRIRRTTSLSSRLQKRRRHLQRMLNCGSGFAFKLPVAREDGFTQTTLHRRSKAVGTEMVLETTASQTPHRQWISSQVDTSDLIHTVSQDQQTFNPSQQTVSIAVGTETVLDSTASQTPHQEWSSSQVDTSDLVHSISRDQQTFNPGHQALSTQTERQVLQSRITQVEVNAKTSTTQTKLVSACLGIQTELHCTNVSVQTAMDCQDTSSQTIDDEQEVMKPHLQALFLIYDSIKDQSDLIHNEVLQAINQLCDLTLLAVKKRRLEEDLPREASLEPLTPIPQNQIGDNLPREKLLSEAKLKKLLLKWDPKFRTKRVSKSKRLSTGPSWSCTMKCKRCGLHMHRNRLRVSSDNQETQTEVAETEDAVVWTETGTQTERERGRWTLKRS